MCLLICQLRPQIHILPKRKCKESCKLSPYSHKLIDLFSRPFQIKPNTTYYAECEMKKIMTIAKNSNQTRLTLVLTMIEECQI